ncbi:hypothetical protein DID88_006021 [Monilinia fructigena]|uniref:Uncharacterized protein n=1 Tax=Monilinia fructigena TaxID=38457 RepID=A0A395J1I7_9HELO|nr:hypothetical protein DID88_006021 [Monilinia fructigena]
MSSGNYSGERAPPRGSAKDPRRDERYNGPERRRDTREMQVDDDDDDYDSVAQQTLEGRRIEKHSRSTSKTGSILKSPVGSSDQELIKTELISAFTNLADLISSRNVQARRKTEMEEDLKTTTEEINKVKSLERQAIEDITSRLIFKAPPPIDHSANILQERCLNLEEKIGELEKTIAGIDRTKDVFKINDRLEDFESKHRDIIGMIQTIETSVTGKVQTKCQSLSDKHTNLSEKYIKLEEQHRATQTDFGSTRSRVDSHEKSLQKHIAAIDNSKQEMATLQQRISKNYAIIKAKDNDIEQLTRKVMDLQKLLDTHQSSFNHFNSSNHLERLNRVENIKTIVAELQSQHKTTLINLENCQGEISALKDKVTHIEKAPQAPSTPAPQVMSTPSTGSNTTMIGVMQNNIRNLQRDMRNLQERFSQAPNRSRSQDAALISEQLNITRFESRLSEVEDSMKEVRSFSIDKPAMKESPFSTTNQTDLVTKQRVEELKADMKATRRDSMIMNEQINSIKEKLALIPNIQDGMKELLNRLTESSAQTETQLNNRLNGIINSQNGNTMAITQLNSRMANISTADLAKNMLGQLETFYPDIRKVGTTLSEHKKLLLEHTAQQSSPRLFTSRSDALSRDQIQLEADTKTNKTILAALEEASATIKTALDSLTKKVNEEKKRLTLMEEAFSDELAELSVKVDSLLPDNDNNTRGLADVTLTPALPTMPSAGQSSTQETAINDKKRKVATAAESAKASGSTNGYTPSPSRKRARRAEDDNEDL